MLIAGLVLACDAPEPGASTGRAPWPEGSLVAAALPLDARAVIASAGGAIYLSDDAGRSFQRAHLPAVPALTALVMVDAEIGWAVGPGVVLRTEDGGARWERQRLPGRAAAHPLVAVAALDRQRACALDERGGLLETVDGGAVWRVRSEPAPAAGGAGADGEIEGARLDGGALIGVRGDDPACHVVRPGRAPGPERFAPGEGPLSPVLVAPPFEGGEIAFRAGGFEPSEQALEAWLAAAERLRGEPVDWTIDVRVSRAEIDRASIDRDPGTLFDLIEGRGEELIRRLEEVGVPSERISLQAPPPWGFEDHLDDDPGFLERYWQDRLATVPGARIETHWDATLDRIGADRAGDAMLVTGAGAQAFVRSDRTEPLVRTAAPGRLLPLALGRLGDAWVAVGQQGEIWEAEVVDDSGALVWRAGALAGDAAFFEALRAVAVSPSGRSALVVGDGGRMLWREPGVRDWRLRSPPAQALGPRLR